LSQLLESLLHLQRLDDTLQEMRKRKQEIPAQMRAFEQELESARNRLEDLRKRHQEAVRSQKRLEKELEESMEQLRKKQSRKFEVKTNEEYRAILKEIEFTQQTHSEMEDAILRLLEEIDSLERQIRTQAEEVKRLEARVKDEKARLEQESDLVEREHEEVFQQRKAVCALLQKEIVAEYEKLRTRRAGLAVVVLKSEICPGCHMAIPYQTINEVLQTGEIRHCPYCRRILYCES